MDQRTAYEATALLENAAIRFRRLKDGYFTPFTLIDRAAIILVRVNYKPSRDPDEILEQFADRAWVEFLEYDGSPLRVED